MFTALQPAVEQIARTLHIQPNSRFTQLLHDELADVPVTNDRQEVDRAGLHTLYELRARHLDWELGTGYLGFFAKNAGTRYTFTRRMEAVFQLLPPLNAQQQVLEIGCGAGLLCLELARQAQLVVGTDISRFALDFANRVKDFVNQQNVSFQFGEAEALMFREQSFDLVVCSEVLEHLLAPQQALMEMRRVIKDSGAVILSTPCAVSFSDLCMGLAKRFSHRIEAEQDVHFDKKTYLAMQRAHQSRVNAATFMRVHERFQYAQLLTMFHNAGFEVEQSIGTVLAFPPHYQVFYRYCPALLLPAVRGLEHLGNRLGVFPKFGAVTTCFKLKPRSVQT